MNFTNKVVLITGASSGIGATTAEAFVKCGAKVVIVGRNVQNLKETEQACKKLTKNADILPIVADVTSDANKIIKQTIDKYGKLDVLVNNAGILELGSILECDVEQLDRVLNVNLRAVFVLTQLAIPHLIKSQGNIVNVSSVAGIRSLSGSITYGISKAALDQFTRCCALDLGLQNVRVNAVNPGLITTGIHKRAGMSETEYDKYVESAKGKHALGRVGNAEEVAQSIVFLASDNASFITGATLPIDGGKHAMCPR